MPDEVSIGPEETCNQDVAMINNRLNTYIDEIMLSQSKDQKEKVLADDAARITIWVENTKKLFDMLNAQPQLDLPKTHPTKQRMTEDPDNSAGLTNMILNDLIQLFEGWRNELRRSGSSLLPSAFNEDDADRFDRFYTKIKQYLAYLVDVGEIDNPETSKS